MKSAFIKKKKKEKNPKGKYLAPDFIAGRFPAMLIWQIIIIIF